MINLRGDIKGIIDAERALGRSDAAIHRAIKLVMDKVGRKYRMEIARAAAAESNIPEEILIKRGAFFPRSGRYGAYGVLSFLTVKLPSILLDPNQDAGGVSTSPRYIPGAFIRHANKFGKAGSRDFVFKRKGRARYPISEQKEDVYFPVLQAIEQLKPEIQKYIQVELTKEFSRGFL